MFKDCKSLAELNAERIQLLQKDGVDPLEINNAYNARKLQLLSESELTNRFARVNPIILEAEPVQEYSSIPFVGDPLRGGCISLKVPS